MSSGNTPKFLYDSLAQDIQLCEKTELIRTGSLKNKQKFSYKFFINNKDLDEVRKDIVINIQVDKIESSQYYCSVVEYLKLQITSTSFPEDVYYAIYDGRYDTEKQINKEKLSEEIRTSRTFIINGQNSYETKHTFFVVGDRTFILCSKKRLEEINESSQKYNKQTIDKFDRFLLLFLLALAYNARMDAFLKDSLDIYNTYKSENTNLSDTIYKRIIDFREYVYFFNLKYFFEFPVKQDRHELFKIWELISNTYLVKQKHDEINAQVSALTKVITLNQNEKKLEEEKVYQNKMQKRDKEFEKNIAFTGMALAFAPIAIELVKLFLTDEGSVETREVLAYIFIILLILLTLFHSIIYRTIKEIVSKKYIKKR